MTLIVGDALHPSADLRVLGYLQFGPHLQPRETRHAYVPSHLSENRQQLTFSWQVRHLHPLQSSDR